MDLLLPKLSVKNIRRAIEPTSLSGIEEPEIIYISFKYLARFLMPYTNNNYLQHFNIKHNY